MRTISKLLYKHYITMWWESHYEFYIKELETTCILALFT